MTPFGELVGDGSPPLSEFKSQVTSIIPEIDLLMSSVVDEQKIFMNLHPLWVPLGPFCEGERPSGGGRGRATMNHSKYRSKRGKSRPYIQEISDHNLSCSITAHGLTYSYIIETTDLRPVRRTPPARPARPSQTQTVHHITYHTQ